MAYKVIWSSEAIQDLDDIAEYIHRDSPLNAGIVVGKFLELVSQYGSFPKAATIVSEIGKPNYRHKQVYGWRVIYRIDEGDRSVVILAIIHGKRQFSNLHGRFWDE